MTEHAIEHGIEETTQKKEVPFPEDAPALADWIEAELGDDDLAHFLREHPEGAELLANGEAILPRTVFDIVDDLIDINPERAKEFAGMLNAKDLLPQLSYQQGVGNVSEDTLADIYLERKYLLAQDRLSLRDGEVAKDEHDRLYINTANNALARLRAKYGLPDFVVPEEAVRFIPAIGKQFAHVSGKNFSASFSQTEQSANFSDESTPPQRLHDMLHELTHFHSYGSFQVDESRDNDQSVEAYRVGLTVIARQNEGVPITPTYLELLNEAVTEETANRLYGNIREDDPDLSEFAKNRNQLTTYLDQECATFLARNRLRSYWVSHGERADNGEINFFSTYAQERNMMFDMFKRIYEKNPERFEGRSPEEAEEELFEMLQRAMFTGNILPFGRLFNETFGHGKFREFGHLQTTEQQQAFIEGL